MSALESREANQDFAGRRLVLGFDAGCMTCSDLAHRIEEQVGDKMEVRPLDHPQVAHWREQALGENATWAPTLVEVKGNEVKGWTGMKMALILSQKLGPVGSWRVMQLVGEIKSARTTEMSSTATGISRGQFLKKSLTGAVGGAAATVGLFSIVTSPALATSGESTRAIKRGKQLDRAIALMERHMRVKDNTLLLNERGLANDLKTAEAGDIDSEVFAELKRELAKTNRVVKEDEASGGSSQAQDLFPTIEPLSDGESSSFTTRAACPGRSGVERFWWGKRSYLNTCETDDLVGRMRNQASSAAILAVFPPAAPAALPAALYAVGSQGIAGSDRGRGVYINYIARLIQARVKPQ